MSQIEKKNQEFVKTNAAALDKKITKNLVIGKASKIFLRKKITIAFKTV